MGIACINILGEQDRQENIFEHFLKSTFKEKKKFVVIMTMNAHR